MFILQYQTYMAILENTSGSLFDFFSMFGFSISENVMHLLLDGSQFQNRLIFAPKIIHLEQGMTLTFFGLRTDGPVGF